MKKSLFILALSFIVLGTYYAEAATSLPKKPGKHKSHKKAKKKKSGYFYDFQH